MSRPEPLRVRCAPLAGLLWIDDELDVGLLRFLALEGFSITSATTGEEGLALARASSYEIIVVDLRLPDVHGLTVIQRLRTAGITCPILAVTGNYVDCQTPDHARAAGATTLQFKPLWADEAASALRELVNPVCHDRSSLAVPSPREDACSVSSHSDLSAFAVRARLEHVISLAHNGDVNDGLTRVLLSALATTQLSLPAFRGCASGLRMILTTPPGATSVDHVLQVVRTAERQPFTSRHCTMKRALTLLQTKPYWWEEENLARELAVSRSHFARLVCEVMNIDYRTLRRLVVMKGGIVEVLTTDDQVAQIAQGLGMRPGTFDEIFRDVFGQCPRNLRREWNRLFG